MIRDSVRNIAPLTRKVKRNLLFFSEDPGPQSGKANIESFPILS